jgi:protein O-GlcNAc transferase
MLKWIATKLETRRTNLQSRLGATLQAPDPAGQPASAEEWRKRGNAHLNSGNLDEAADCYRRGVEVNPDDSICYSNLGYALGELGQAAESQEMLLKAVELNPADFDAHYLLGNLARARGEWLQAIARYREALKAKPDFDLCRRELCISLAQAGQIREAREALEQGPAFAVDSADFYYFRGNLHLAADEFDDALANFRQADKLQPRDASILINLGVAQLKRRDVFPALETYRSILEFEPDNVQAHANMAIAYQQSSQLDQAIQSYRYALELNPEFLNAHQNLLFALTYVPDLPAAEYLRTARQYGERVAARAKRFTHWNCPPAGGTRRPLRVGFVSGDLRSHPVGMFLENILAQVDPAKLELVAYSSTVTEDVVTGRLKSLFSEWHSIATLADEALAQKIHSERIDILVDLAGHTGLNRLSVFAWKAAPLQVSWLGYWASTGVAEIDYILVDPVSAPESDGPSFSERLWHLPDSRLCLSPPVTSRPIEVTQLPALRNGFVTFGSYQILNKISDVTLAAWSLVLARMPSARLRIQSLPLAFPDAVANMRQRLTAAGFDIARVDLHGGAPREDYLGSYGEVDLVLDTFPFPGGTTTAEGLWMGVPTVTLAGHSLLARQGESMLRCAGLADWVARSEQEFVEIALKHANDLDALAELRAGLRSRALASPLFDAARFARNLENAFAAMAHVKGDAS